MSQTVCLSHLGLETATGTQWTEARLLLCMLQCTGQPSLTKNYSAPNVNSDEVGKAWLKVITECQHTGPHKKGPHLVICVTSASDSDYPAADSSGWCVAGCERSQESRCTAFYPAPLRSGWRAAEAAWVETYLKLKIP